MPAFDKRISDFQAANTQVLGISTDSPFSHDNWARSVGISHYPLLSDIHRIVSRDYGVYWPEWNANVRATFIVDKQGKIRFIERYGKGELPEPDKILAEITKLSPVDG
jgi:alkyl hydroperoxide reductase subunit AhpC